jgi:hypothetical protein
MPTRPRDEKLLLVRSHAARYLYQMYRDDSWPLRFDKAFPGSGFAGHGFRTCIDEAATRLASGSVTVQSTSEAAAW